MFVSWRVVLINDAAYQSSAPNVRVDRAARINATFAAPIMLRNTLPPLASNELFGGELVQARYDTAIFIGDNNLGAALRAKPEAAGHCARVALRWSRGREQSFLSCQFKYSVCERS